jgi:hypothetical protein
MSWRQVGPEVLANISAPHVTLFMLVEMRLDSGTLYLTDCPHAVDWLGQTWVSVYGIGGISEVTETASEAKGLVFTLSGVADGIVGIVMNEPLQGRVVVVRLATLTVAKAELEVDENVWRGTLDATSIERTENGVTVSITAEHMLAMWDRPNLVLHTDADQQRLHPGDKF